jgi:spore maturation protein CgeB
MKIIIVAEWHGDIYGQAFYNSFKSLNHEVFKFSWKEYFVSPNRYYSALLKIQNKYTTGPVVWKINYDIVQQCKDIKPDLIFVYGGTHVYKRTLERLKQASNAKIYGYNNDDPFSKKYPKYFWRHFIKSIYSYDHIFAYRKKNIKDYEKINYTNVSILRSYYRKECNYYIENLPSNKYICDVAFIGHFENDGRDEIIKYLIESNVNIRLYGPEWSRSKHYDYFVNYQKGSVIALHGEDYNLAINSAKIALVFLSKLNNDTYTRRCFEIPATKTMMMAEYTDDLNSMFKEGVEAEYFRNKEDLLGKIKYFLNNKERIDSIATNGYKRLLFDGHEVLDRCQEILKFFQKKN